MSVSTEASAVRCVKEEPSLIIFDCDGVLVDSEPLSLSTLADLLRRLGLAIDDQDAIDRFRGRRIAECLAEVEQQFDYRLPAGFEERFREEAAKRFVTDLQAVQGVAQALDSIYVPTCVASSAPLKKIRLTLSLTGLLDRFDGRIFSAYEIGAWKPDPTLFMHAARVMGAPSSRTVVIEDSVVGVQAGVAAGMTVLGFAPGERMNELARAGAAATFSSMDQLSKLIPHSKSLSAHQ